MLHVLPIVAALASGAPVPKAADTPQGRLREYMARLAAEADKERLPPPGAGPHSPLETALHECQDLADRGRYADALKALDAAPTAGLGDDWKEMLGRRREVLAKWAGGGRVELGDYESYYLTTGPRWWGGRATPVVRLWNMADVPAVPKYHLLAALLDQKQDPAGVAVVMEALPEARGVTPAEAAAALCRAATARLGLKAAAAAERNWVRVVEEFPATRHRGEAAVRLGHLYKGRGEHAKAVRAFELALPRPGGPRPGPFDASAHAAAVGLSECYEAAGDLARAVEYAEKARTEFPFRSGCGTCDTSARKAVADRIAGLRAKLAAQP